ncbi:hypothetical protein [Rhodococcus aerolatus]
MEEHPTPAWRRETPAERRWPAALATVVVVALQLGLPDQLTFASPFLLPSVEAALLVVLLATNGSRVDRSSGWLRHLGLALVAVASLANAYSVVRLVQGLLDGSVGGSAGPLLTTSGSIYLTNVVVFALWYWELDRGGPARRAQGRSRPDFLFPQMTLDDPAHHVVPPHWEPRFVDYLYVSATNATAFSPTDTMPLTRWAKLTMLGQSAVALVTVALVVARAVNILGS